MNENEIMMKAKYINIVIRVINYFNRISINKCIFLVFCINNCISNGDNMSHVKYDIFEKILARFGSKFLLNKSEFRIIFDCLDVLINTEYIVFDGSDIKKTSKLFSNVEDFSKKETKIFEEIKSMDDSWFMEEIIKYV